jgi:hypothetical protein
VVIDSLGRLVRLGRALGRPAICLSNERAVHYDAYVAPFQRQFDTPRVARKGGDFPDESNFG